MKKLFSSRDTKSPGNRKWLKRRVARSLRRGVRQKVRVG